MAEAIARLLGEIKAARTDEARARAARKLREWVRMESRGGTDSSFHAHMNSVNNRIFELINSPDPNDKLGGIAAIYELTDEPVPDNETKIVRFANYLRVVAPSSGDAAVLRMSSKALGHLARAGGTMTAEFVEYEAKRALEWLQTSDARAESRKLASVLILRELADAAPTLFYPHMHAFFVHIPSALTDSKVVIRENAAKALHSCLVLVTARRSRNRDVWFASCYNWARSTLQSKAGAPEYVHGALLTLGELLANTGQFLTARFIDVCEMVLKYSTHKDKLVRRTVIVLLPRLAHFHPETFVRAYADGALSHLLACLRDPKQVTERGTAYVAIGRTALAIGARLASDALRHQLERIVAVVKEGLTPGTTPSTTLGVTRGRTRPFVPEALTCVAMLARAVGPALMEYMHDIIDPMFSDGLSVMLTETLQAVAEAIPAMRPLLQERLLHEVSLVLANRPFTPPFVEPTPPVSPAAAMHGMSASNVGVEDYLTLLAPFGSLSDIPGVTSDAPRDGRMGPGMASDAYGAMELSGLALPSNSRASNRPANALAALAALISAGPYATSTGSSSAVAGGSAAGLPVTVMTPTTMSWARNMPSAGMSSVDQGGMTSAAGGLSAASAFEAAGVVQLASVRGVPDDLVCLCLHTLGTFDFTGVPLLPFAREVVMAYMDAEDPAVRLEAALTCCRLMVRPTDVEGSSVDPLLVNAGLDHPGGDDNDGMSDDDDYDDDEELSGGGVASDHEEGSPARRLVVEGKDSESKAAAAPQASGITSGDASVSTAQALGVDADGLEPYHDALETSETERRRRLIQATKSYLRRLKPAYHPLLVFGSESIAAGLGMGAHTSPVALVLAGYSGGIADVSAQVYRAGLAKRLRRMGAGSRVGFLGSMSAVIGSGPTLMVVTQLLQRLLVMALTDPDPAVRFEVLASLDERYDALLVEPSNLRLLFQGLQDENFACREGFLALLGRLVAHNPAYILPAVRKTLLSVLAELEYLDAHPDPVPIISLRGGTQPAAAVAGATKPGGLSETATGRAAATATGLAASEGNRGSVSEFADASDATVPGMGTATSATAASRIHAYRDGVAHDVVMACASGGTGRDHAARMLGLLIRSCQRLVAPYVPVILRALLPHAWGVSTARALFVGDASQPIRSTVGYITSTAHQDVLSTCVLAALGELSAVGADAMLPYMQTIVPLVVDAVTQGAHALGVSHTGVATAVQPSFNAATSSALARGVGAADATLTDIDSVAGVSAGGAPLTSLPGATATQARQRVLPPVSMHIADPLLFTEVATRTLGLLVENTGLVITPYVDHPHLLQLLLAILARPTPFASSANFPGQQAGYTGSRSASRGSRKDAPAGVSAAAAQWSLRREVMRTVGITGALDPYRHRMAQIAQVQRAATAAQAAVQARLAAAVAAAKARGRRIAAAGLTPSVVTTGMKPGAGIPFVLYEDDAEALVGKDASDVNAVILNADGSAAASPWSLHAYIPSVTGVAVGAGLDIDPMEAAMAGLAGEAGANVGINLDEVGIGMGPVGTTGAQAGDALLGAAAGLFPVFDALGGMQLPQPRVTTGSQGAETGAADPAAGDGPDGAPAGFANMAASAILPSMVANAEDFYPTVALTALLSILADETLALHHNNVLQAVMLILRSLGTKCVAFLPKVMPAFLSVLRTAALKARAQASAVAAPGSRGIGSSSTIPQGSVPFGDGGTTLTSSMGAESNVTPTSADNAASLRDTVLQQLSALVSLVKHHIRPWLPAVFGLLREVWPASLPSLLRLVEATAAALGVEAKPFISMLIPHMLSVLTHDGGKPVLAPVASGAVFQHEASLTALLAGFSAAPDAASLSTPSPSRLNTRYVLHAITTLVCGGRRALWGGHRHLLDDHMDLLIPAVVRLVDAGIGVIGVTAATADDEPAAASNTGAVKDGPPGQAAASTAPSGGAIMWVTTSGVPSCSSSLAAYGPVAPIVRRQAIDTLAAMAASGVDVSSFAPRVIHALCRVLADSTANTPVDVKRTAVDALCLLLLQLGEDFVPWIAIVRKAVTAGMAGLGSASSGADGSSSTAVGNSVGPSVAPASSLSSAGVAGASVAAAADAMDAGGGGVVPGALGSGAGGVSGTGAGGVVRHETYERLVCLLLGLGTGYGYVGDDGMALYGYGAPLPLPTNPVDLANLLYDPGLADDSGPRIASALALSSTGAQLTSSAAPAFGGTVLDGAGGAAAPPGAVPGLLGTIGTDDSLTMSLSALMPAGLSLLSGAEGVKKLPVNQETLKRAWETNARSTKEDWTEWMRRFSVDLLRESPSPALRSCCALAQVYSPLASDLFNAAFVAVWAELYDEYQDSLVQSLETAFNSESTPATILQALLNLAEFMEHDEKALPIDVRNLGQLAARVGAFAKALHYKEMEFHTSPGSCIETLISINNQLEQPEAAVGILKFAQLQAHGVGQLGYRASHQTGGASAAAFMAGIAGMEASDGSGPSRDGDGASGGGLAVDVQEGWYEKLGRWEDALDAYERKQVDAPNSLSLVLGQMRCLKALGEWQRLDDLSRSTWPRLLENEAGRAAVAPHAARAAWALGNWNDMEVYIAATNEYSLQGAFFRAVLSIHRLHFADAQRFIDRARKVLAAEFAAMGNEAYSRAYRRMVTVQQLSEMEEILTYLRLSAGGNAPGADTYIKHVRNMWEARLRGCAKNVDVWNRILSVRSLVTIASENMMEWLHFAALCRRSGRMNMSLKVLMGLGMDGGGGMSAAVSRYLLGQGSIHGRPRGQDGSARGNAVPTALSMTMPLPVAPALVAPSTVDAANPMLLPDHPYQPYELNYRSTREALLEATARVGTGSAAHPRVVYAYLKHLWWSGYREAAVEQLKVLTQSLDAHAADRQSRVPVPHVASSSAAGDEGDMFGSHRLPLEDEQALRVQCHLRLGQWLQALAEPAVNGYAQASVSSFTATEKGSPIATAGAALSVAGPSLSGSPSRSNTRMPSDVYAALVAPALITLRTATHECGSAGYGHYRAWHTWALVNFAAAEHHYENLKTEREAERTARSAAAPGTSTTTRGSASSSSQSAPAQSNKPVSSTAIAQAVTAHAVAAVKAFLRSIALGRTRLKAYVLQDLLRLLTLWFTHGETAQVRQALEAGLSSGAVSIEVWLQVIPQLIARIHVQASATRKLLHSLLMQIGQVHPQALVYPLTVACKSASAPRRTASLSIVSVMRRRWSRLLDQAEMVSKELIRTAILWHEMWHSGLEEASRQFFGDHNEEGMFETLLPLHEMMTNPGPQTAREISFAQTFAADLARAGRLLHSYRSTGVLGDITQAWDLYLQVFKKINKMLPAMTSLELQFVSPILLAAHDLELSVPGTYTATAPLVRIMAVSPFIDILSSKQRPRKVTMLGSDGRRYTFLLKGHEDLRQDERVMQLFGLVNTLLANDAETSRRDLSIRRYAVTPLSHNAGVVGWVPNCDTLHALIREYRENRKVLLNIEHRLMVQMAPMYDFLTVLQKVEVFRYALDNTTGQDLYKVLWLKSASSEVWLDRRTNYTRSLAAMSIVGYILGLGDRHPSNLMLDRVSGKILHIDFGDCFEVAMTRDKFPERVPFRLTRMLVNAMEVSGIEGNYRSTCEAVMRVMRQHRDSVMAMLEAFVHDPLINWRLLTGGAAPVGAVTAPAAPTATAATTTTTDAAPTRARTGTLTSDSVAGAMRLAEVNPEARPLLQRGLDFAQEAEATALAQAAAQSGFDANGGDATAEAHVSQAIARSLASSSRRGDRERVLMQAIGPEGTAAPSEALNERAVAVTRRIAAKLTGRDFADGDPIGRVLALGIGMSSTSRSAGDDRDSLDVAEQVQRLIATATSAEHLAVAYLGWCPFW